MRTVIILLECIAALAWLTDVVVTLLTYRGLPERIAIHLNFQLEPDQWGKRSFLLIQMAVLSVVAAVYFLYLNRAPAFLAPNSATLVSAAAWGCLAICFITIVQLQFVRIAQGKAVRGHQGLTIAFVLALVCAMASTFINAFRA